MTQPVRIADGLFRRLPPLAATAGFAWRIDMKALFALAATTLLISGGAVAQQRDARGIPVQSEPATPPAGVNEVPTVPPGATVRYAPNPEAFATRPATSEYPPCARGQTDRCTQTYERGSARPRR